MSRTLIWNSSATDQTLPEAYGELVLGPGNGFVTTDSVQTVVVALGGFADMNGKFNAFPIDDAEALGERQVSAVSSGDGGGGSTPGGPIYAADVLGLALVATTGSYGNLINKPALKPVATSGSFNDLIDKPAIPAASSDTPASLGAAFAGSSPDFARRDHVHAHGDQTGGSSHAVATTLAHGFMSSTDKHRFDALVPSVGNPADVAAAAATGTAAAYARADHAHAHGNQAGGTLHADVTVTSSGFMSATDKAKLDLLNAGSAIASVGTANAAGASTDFSRADHVHSHGAQTDASLHAAASASAAGFMAAADKVKLDAITRAADIIGYYAGSTPAVDDVLLEVLLPRNIDIVNFLTSTDPSQIPLKITLDNQDITYSASTPCSASAGATLKIVVTAATGNKAVFTVVAQEA